MNKNRYTALLLATFLIATSALALAGDTSSLRPPKGSKVAIVVFEDLQCPDCARAEPLLQEAVKTYKIPLVRHDFPLPMHNWSYQAHIMARYFDAKSPALGESFRRYLFENQPSITPQNLRGIAERFADEHNVPLPFAYDPKGDLEAKVKADFQLGQRVGVEHTPTIYVVSNTQRGTPFVEVVDRSKLYEMIDEMLKNSAPVAETPAKAKTTKAAKK